MKRRELLSGIAATASLTACNTNQNRTVSQSSNETFNWRIVTTWLANFPGLGTGVNTLVRYIDELSQGRLKITVYGAGELVPALEVFDAVSGGAVEMGHGAAYYWRSKTEATQFFATIPFGMNAHEMNAWIYYGGGLALWHELYAQFNLISFPAGNTGVQMGGWFNKEINMIEDFSGLKMRIPGIGGEVLRRAGGIPVGLAQPEIYTALQTGSIDATEWVGPYNDLAAGLHDAAQYYYYPGWHEPGTTLECMINLEAWNSLPPDLQSIVKIACQAANMDMISEFNARNANALSTLIDEEGIDVRPFPADVMRRLKAITNEIIEELAQDDPRVSKVWASYKSFMTEARSWQRVSEQAYLDIE